MDMRELGLRSKQYLRTREGVHVAPSIRGLIRHVDATRALHEEFVPDGAGSWASRALFAALRLALDAVSETMLLTKKILGAG